MDKAKAPAPALLHALGAAYSKLDYRAGNLARSEAELLREAGVSTPEHFAAPDTVRTQTVDTPFGKAALVFLPQPEGGSLNPKESLVAAALAAGRRARETAPLVIALSPWGLAGEQRLLDATDPAFDILLGSGPGLGIQGRIEAGNATLWVRAFGKGKAVHEIKILALPERGSDNAWRKGENISFTVIPLSAKITASQQINQIFQQVGD